MHATSRILGLVLVGLAMGSPSGAADLFEVDPVHSSILFRVKHMNVSYAYGRFDTVTGKFFLDEKDPSKSTFELSISAESVSTANPIRDKHLKGPDFFNTKQFPAITFKSKGVSKVPAGYAVSGDLTFKGVTKPAEVVLSVVGTGKGMKGETVTGVEGSLVIKRSDFGMTYMVGPLGDEVRVTASLEGSRK